MIYYERKSREVWAEGTVHFSYKTEILNTYYICVNILVTLLQIRDSELGENACILSMQVSQNLS